MRIRKRPGIGLDAVILAIVLGAIVGYQTWKPIFQQIAINNAQDAEQQNKSHEEIDANQVWEN